MGGFKRGGPKPPPKSRPKAAKTVGVRGRGRQPTRGQKRKSDVVESDSSPEPVRKHVLYDDDDDDVQAEYREAGGTMVGDIWIPPRYHREAQEKTGVRLVIEKIVCENFKSYGGVKEMGPFHKSFSAIVGPNGNGKSNVIDAMLFVFGYRATKIRCKKVSVLIHKSELLPKVDSCGVTVHFVKINDNGMDDESYDVIPNSQIEVTRRASANNNSQYYLDGKPVKFQDVAAFLKENGIDIVHNRFLILQGEVESIAQMPPKRKTKHDTGLLEFLEEVIGTKRYMRSLVSLEDRVAQLNFDREAKLVVVDIVEKEKRELKEPVRKAKDYLRTANSIARAQHKICQWKGVDARTHLATIEIDKKAIEENLSGIQTRLKEIETINKEKEATYSTQEKLAKKLESDRAKMKKALDTADAEYAKNTEQLKRSNVQRKKAHKDLGQTEKELEELEQIPGTHEGQVKQLAAKRDELNEKIEIEEKNVSKDLEKLQSKIDGVSKEKEGIDKNFMQLKKVRDEKKVISETLVSELKVYKEQEDVEKRKLDAIVEDVEGLKEKVKHKEREARSSLGSTIGPLQEKLRQKSEAAQEIVPEEQQKRATFENLQTVFTSAKESFEGSAVSDQTYKAFFAEKKQGRLQGLYGRLKDLAKIDEKYNVAVTVSNHLWEFWVCDNDVTAEACIKTLKDMGLAFQNFICLNKLTQQMQQMRRPFNCPQGSQRLFDLLEFTKPEAAPAFYKAVRDTLVVDNLDVAQRIAFPGGGGGNYKVTTLRGDIIDPSGAMTGGGRAKINGKMNSGMAARLENSVTAEEFTRIKNNFERASKEFEDVTSRKQALDQDVRQLTLKLKDLTAKIDSSKTDIESMKTQLRLKEGRLTEQETKWKACIANPKVIQEKESACKKVQKEYETANGPCEAAEEKAKEIEEKLKFLQLDRKQEIRKKLDFLIDQRKKVIEDFNKFTIALTNYPKTKAKLEKRIVTLKQDIQKFEDQIRTLDATKKAIAESSLKTNEELAEISEKATEARKEVEKLKKAQNEFHKEKVDLEKKEAHHANEMANIANNFRAYTAQIKAIAAQIEKLELQPIPEEEVRAFEILTDEQLKELRLKDLEHKVAKYTNKLKNEKPNLGVLAQYKQKVDEFLAKVEELDLITIHRDEFRTAYINTTGQRLAEFMEGFSVIASKLKEMFRMISMGGDAELDLVDSTDPFLFGVEISVRPARKTWKKISYLSGGEKTLASLALVFALHHFKPSPFYVMDEIDAALDFKNVSIIANYIKDRTKFTQFIIISLRSNMFELADSMLGVYKVDNMSYSIHLGIGKLLIQLKEKFNETSRAFPFMNEYLQNNRAERRKELEQTEAHNKDKFGLDTSVIRELDVSINPEGTDDVVSQSTASPLRTPSSIRSPRRNLNASTTNSPLRRALNASTINSPIVTLNSQPEITSSSQSEIIPSSQPDSLPGSQTDSDNISLVTQPIEKVRNGHADESQSTLVPAGSDSSDSESILNGDSEPDRETPDLFKSPEVSEDGDSRPASASTDGSMEF